MRPIHFPVGGPDRAADTYSWLERARLPVIIALALGSWGLAMGVTRIFAMAF